MAKKVLIITYYWPPSGGAGVQRWLKFVKYLPQYGWEPVVMTPENPDFELQDPSLLTDVHEAVEVLKLPIWEPFAIYRKLMGKKAERKQGVVKQSKGSPLIRMVNWIRGNLFIPDARKFWVRPATRCLMKYLKENKVDVIVTTGPPHSIHLIGLNLKKHIGIPWLADFRDPWTQWDILPQFNLNERSWKKHKQLEFEVLNMASKVVATSKSQAEALDELAGVPGTSVVTNGYDKDDFGADVLPAPDKFRLVHMGLLNEVRNPKYLWQELDRLCHENERFDNALELVLGGIIEESVKQRLLGYEHLSKRIKWLDYVSHQEVLDIYRKSAALLLLINNTAYGAWILPGKLFEYFSARRPIVAFGQKKSDVRDILMDCGYEHFLAYNQRKDVQETLLRLFSDYEQGKSEVNSEKTSRYSREALTEQMATILDELVIH